MITRSRKRPLQHHGTFDEMMSVQSQMSLVGVGDFCRRLPPPPLILPQKTDN